ncbi:MAG: esterase/lipase family protein, partial [Actinomycetota bacterium]
SGGSNLAIQDLCPGRVVTHVALAADAATFALVIDALTHAGAAEGSRFDPRVCLQPTLQGLAPAQARGDVLDAVTAGLTTERVRQEPGLFSYAANRG